ncbi:heat shock protein beta-1-like [Salvelinus sp. IW2-2015]|uniref:heat shock protein beta-1-like n=1 Tax=Salvelinus sp. IW2-2015 TaxID=2691554 RepID=UPI000CDFA3C1|nr:heat shock protein beta-1-like [Salvelinus alpinus]
MADHNKVLPRPLFRRDVNWDPFREWTQPSHMIMEKDFGLPPFLDPGDVSWIDWARNTLASSSWPGYTRYPLFSLSTVLPAAVAPQTLARLQRQLSGGVSEIRTGQGSWRITLDVNHFSPEEISIKTKGGFLEIAGQHDEREDEHGSVSRCFIRKYKLLPGVDLQHVSSSLSGEGVLLVEAPLPGSATTILPSDMVIPIQIKHEQEGKE